MKEGQMKALALSAALALCATGCTAEPGTEPTVEQDAISVTEQDVASTVIAASGVPYEFQQWYLNTMEDGTAYCSETDANGGTAMMPSSAEIDAQTAANIAYDTARTIGVSVDENTVWQVRYRTAACCNGNDGRVFRDCYVVKATQKGDALDRFTLCIDATNQSILRIAFPVTDTASAFIKIYFHDNFDGKTGWQPDASEKAGYESTVAAAYKWLEGDGPKTAMNASVQVLADESCDWQVLYNLFDWPRTYEALDGDFSGGDSVCYGGTLEDGRKIIASVNPISQSVAEYCYVLADDPVLKEAE